MFTYNRVYWYLLPQCLSVCQSSIGILEPLASVSVRLSVSLSTGILEPLASVSVHLSVSPLVYWYPLPQYLSVRLSVSPLVYWYLLPQCLSVCQSLHWYTGTTCLIVCPFVSLIIGTCNYSRKKLREVAASLPGRFLSRRCFTLCQYNSGS